MAFGGTVVEFSPTTNPLATPSWVDITSYVVDEINIQTGRSAEFDDMPAGSLSLRLDNSDRRFDAVDTSGPYYGNLRARNRIRVRSTWDTLFTGWVTSWPQSSELMTERLYAEVQATDALGLLAGARLQGTPYTQVLRKDGALIHLPTSESGESNRLEDLIGFTSGSLTGSYARYDDDTGDATSKRFVRFFATGAEARLGNPYASTPESTQSLEFWIRTTSTQQGIILQMEPGSTWYAAALTGNSISLGAGTAGSYRINDGSWHHFVGTYDGSVQRHFVDGVKVYESSAGAPKPFGINSAANVIVGGKNNVISTYFDGDLKDIVLYNVTLTEAQVTQHYNAAKGWPGDSPGTRIGRILDLVGWPSADRDLSTGTVVVSPLLAFDGTVAEHLQRIGRAEGGMVYADRDGKVAFRGRYDRQTLSRSINSQAWYGTSSAYLRYINATMRHDDEQLQNTVNVSVSGSDRVFTLKDAASVSSFFDAEPYDLTDLELDNENDAIGVGVNTLNRLKLKTERIDSITIDGRESPFGLETASDLRLNDRVDITYHPNGVGSSNTYFCYIEGLSHSIDFADRAWITTLRTSLTNSVSVFILGTSSLDSGILAP